jgi:hypothetical protein
MDNCMILISLHPHMVDRDWAACHIARRITLHVRRLPMIPAFSSSLTILFKTIIAHDQNRKGTLFEAPWTSKFAANPAGYYEVEFIVKKAD